MWSISYYSWLYAADLWFNWNLNPHIAKCINSFPLIALHSKDEHNTV